MHVDCLIGGKKTILEINLKANSCSSFKNGMFVLFISNSLVL